MALEIELATYQRELPKLLEQTGKFVVIVGEKVIDTFGTYDDALKAGYREAKLEPFLVKQILTVDRVQFVSRFAELCQA